MSLSRALKEKKDEWKEIKTHQGRESRDKERDNKKGDKQTAESV